MASWAFTVNLSRRMTKMRWRQGGRSQGKEGVFCFKIEREDSPGLLFEGIIRGHISPSHENADDLSGTEFPDHLAIFGQIPGGMPIDLENHVAGPDAHILRLASWSDPKD